MTVSEVQSAFAKAMTGRGAYSLDLEQFRELAAYAVAQGVIVSDVEAYEIDGEAHVIRTALGMWPHPLGDLPWREKLAGMPAEITRFGQSLLNENKEFLINVWLDDNA